MENLDVLVDESRLVMLILILEDLSAITDLDRQLLTFHDLRASHFRWAATSFTPVAGSSPCGRLRSSGQDSPREVIDLSWFNSEALLFRAVVDDSSCW